MRTQFKNSWQSVRSSYWFVPSLILLAAIGLSLLTQQLDSRFQESISGVLPGVLQGGPDGARSMLAAIAGSMITSAAVTFSITIAALANASSQFGPRLLRIFMQDTGSQIVLGTLVGTFIYCLLVLRLVPVEESSRDVPHISTSVALFLALAGIGSLIYFIHHMASMLQVSHVTARVGGEMLQAIEQLFPERLGWGPRSEDQADSIPISGTFGSVLPDGNQRSIQADRIGYIQAVDEETLLDLAIRFDVVIRIGLRPGTFIVPDALLAVVWPADRATEELENALQRVFLVGSRRTPFQDIELFFDELIEIALRALSPGINDPYTAFTCIDWLTAGLTTMATRQLPSRYRYDQDHELRVIADGPEIIFLISRIFDQIRDTSLDYPSVLRKLIESATIVGPLLRSSSEIDALRVQLSAIDHVARVSTFAEHERTMLRHCYQDALRSLNTTL